MNQAPRPKSSNNGCLVAAAIVAAIGALVIAGAAYTAYSFSTSKEGEALIGAIGDGAKMLADAQNAPGAAELRALGCADATIVDMDRLAKLAQELGSDGGGVPASQVSLMVGCEMAASATPLGCAEVAKAYLAAAPPPDRSFAVSVTVAASRESACSMLYGPDGSEIADLKSVGAIP